MYKKDNIFFITTLWKRIFINILEYYLYVIYTYRVQEKSWI